MFWIIVGVVVVLDRLSKILITSTMELGQFIGIGNSGIGLRYVQNSGAAFSFFAGRTGFLLVFTAMLMAALLFYWYKFRDSMSKAEQVFLAMILGGGLGNYIDRLFSGYVVDFLDIRIIPIFNVADICITCGCLLLIFAVFYSDGHKNKHEAPPSK